MTHATPTYGSFYGHISQLFISRLIAEVITRYSSLIFTYYFQHTTNGCQADNMAVIHVAKLNYITSGHLETHLFTRNKHTCTKHPAILNMRFHFIFYALSDAVFSFSPETVIYTSRVIENHRTCIFVIYSLKFVVVLNVSCRVI